MRKKRKISFTTKLLESLILKEVEAMKRKRRKRKNRTNKTHNSNK
jgi:hypothetical protein